MGVSMGISAAFSICFCVDTSNAWWGSVGLCTGRKVRVVTSLIASVFFALILNIAFLCVMK